MICVFPADAEVFTGNGVGMLAPTKCEVSETLNGEYELVMEHVLDDGHNDQGQAEWHATLDRMVFLFHEADEERCARKNPYEDEHHQAYREFEAKYGMFGEKLRESISCTM